MRRPPHWHAPSTNPQEPASEDDEGLAGAVNVLVSGDATIEPMEEVQLLEEQAAPAAAAQPAQAAATAAGGEAAGCGVGGGGAINAGVLAAALGNIMGAGTGGLATAAELAALRAQLASQPSLSEVLRPEVVGPLLEQSPTLADRLAPHLPEAYRSPAAIRQLLSTPQFRHQARHQSAPGC